MNLDPDLQRILNPGAKVYNVKTKQQGKVAEVTDSEVSIEYREGIEGVELQKFKQMLVDDQIVSNSRLTMGSGSNFKVLPRTGQVNTTRQSTPTKPIQSKHKEPKLEVGYINFKTGKFSEESKRGYTKVEYRKAVQKVELEVDEDQLRKLREMGLI